MRKIFLIATALLATFNFSYASRTDSEEKTITKLEVSFVSDHPVGTIVIRTDERQLYYVLGNNKAYRYTIAVGTEDNQWIGKTVITRKAENPPWHPTPDQLKKSPKLKVVEGGEANNPLGARALYFGWSALRIHGTIAPGSIGRAASNGCYRMHNVDVKDLYKIVHVGTPIIVER